MSGFLCFVLFWQLHRDHPFQLHFTHGKTNKQTKEKQSTQREMDLPKQLSIKTKGRTQVSRCYGLNCVPTKFTC